MGLFRILSVAAILAAPVWSQPRPRPHAQVDRLSRMPPAQRQRMLSKLPPERKAKIEQRLERYNKLPPEQREKLKKEYDTFQRLSPEKQEALRQEFRKFNNLPSDRHKPIRQELTRLRKMTPEKRERRMGSEAFKEKYSEEERQMLERMSGLMHPAQRSSEDPESP